MNTHLVLGYLQSGPLKLAVAAVLAWLGLFTLFASSGFSSHDHEFRHAVDVVPNGVVEKRVFPVAELQHFALSTVNRLTLSSINPLSYVSLTFDTNNFAAGPTINRQTLDQTYLYYLNSTVSIPVPAQPTAPWEKFGLSPANAVELNTLAYPDRRWDLIVYAWALAKTPERRVVKLSFSDRYTPGSEFATIAWERADGPLGSWSVSFSPDAHPSASTKALAVQRTLALFLWPAFFNRYLSAGRMAGVILVWVCLLTVGYAGLTIVAVHWAVRKTRNSSEERRRRSAALRWEEEGWTSMNAIGEPDDAAPKNLV